MTRSRYQDCPHCGATFRVGRLACPECGSDAETGWRDAEDIDYLSVEIPDDMPRVTPTPTARLARRMLILALAAAIAWVLLLS